MLTDEQLDALRRTPRQASVSDVEDLVSEVDRLRLGAVGLAQAELLERADIMRRAAERGLGQAHELCPATVDAWQHVLDEVAALRCRAEESAELRRDGMS